MPSTPTKVYLPSLGTFGVNAGPLIINQAGDLAALLFEIPKTGTVTGMKFITASVTTGCTIRGTIQTISPTTSIPTGTLYDANATGTVVVANGASSTTFTVTFAGNVSATKGDVVALVLDVSSGAPSALQIRSFTPKLLLAPTSYKITTGVGSFVINAAVPSICLTYNTGDFVAEASMFTVTTTRSASTTTSPDEIGNKFTAPFNCECDGFAFQPGTPANFKATDIVLYDSANNVVATKSLSASLYIGIGSSIVRERWPTPVNLKKGQVYRIVAKPTTSTTWTGLFAELSTFAVRAQDLIDISHAKTSRTDAGAWTDDTSAIVNLAITVDKVYQPGGSFM